MREHWLHRHVVRQDERNAGREWRIRWAGAQIISRPTHRVEYRLGRLEETEAVRPAVVIRATVRILLGKRQPIRRVVGRPRASLVLAVLGDEQATLQGMIVWCEANAVGIAVAPRERLNGAGRVLPVNLCAQDCPVAYAMMERPGECLDGPARIGRAKGRIAAGLDAAAAIRADAWS